MLQNSFKLEALYKVKFGQHIKQKKFMYGQLYVLSKLIDLNAHMAYEKITLCGMAHARKDLTYTAHTRAEGTSQAISN